jgi:hypothetical protein
MVAVLPIVPMRRMTRPGIRPCARKDAFLPETGGCETSLHKTDPGLVARADFRMAENAVSCTLGSEEVREFGINFYAALEDKADQLKLSQFTGLKGVLLCDGGCDALSRRGQRGLNVDASGIIVKFLSDCKSVDFVMTMLV